MAVAASGPFAENVLLCDIKIGEGVAAAKILKNILEKCCALYNAGGGVLEMRIVDFEDLEPPHNELNRFWSTLEQKLKALIEPLSYVDVFERTFDRNSGKVYLFIKNVPNHFCTLRFNLFLAGDSGIYEASNIEAINVMTKPLNLKKKRHSDVDAPLSSLPKVDKEFAYGESVSFHESRRIEFKHYKSEQILSENNRTQCDNLRKIISSFANTNGGVIYLGITDEGIAFGHNLERDSTEAIEERVHFLIDKMYWSVTPKREVHWDLKFFPVVGKENHSVIVIYVAGMQTSGGVFAKCPVSVELRPSEDGSEGQVHLLDFDEWKQRMVGRTDVQTVQTDSKGLYDCMYVLITSNDHYVVLAYKVGPRLKM
ncbi:platelet maturation [Desmophyllum pertusum]|uniref:Platelet maturation n=1 Tax=Desmophyllum pertusum TaxID=174260 RepID=A0A9W9YIP6_9CNID|nr:platelet maturation [Desmophyllum pertusum]